VSAKSPQGFLLTSLDGLLARAGEGLVCSQGVRAGEGLVCSQSV